MFVQVMEDALREALLFTCHNGRDPLGLPQPLAKKLQYHLPSHLIMDDKLFFCKGSHVEEQMLEVPSRAELSNILASFHSSCFARHFQIKQILQRLQEAYHWKEMVQDVTAFC